MIWSDEMINTLKDLWESGKTTSEIAKILGVSKNSIVGKVHRLNLSARPSPIKKTEEKCKVAEVKHSGKNNNCKKHDVENADTECKCKCEKTTTTSKCHHNGIGLTELDNHTCRWPIGDPRDENFRFCGKKVKTGQTYCEEHSEVAYVKR